MAENIAVRNLSSGLVAKPSIVKAVKRRWEGQNGHDMPRKSFFYSFHLIILTKSDVLLWLGHLSLRVLVWFLSEVAIKEFIELRVMTSYVWNFQPSLFFDVQKRNNKPLRHRYKSYRNGRRDRVIYESCKKLFFPYKVLYYNMSLIMRFPKKTTTWVACGTCCERFHLMWRLCIRC